MIENLKDKKTLILGAVATNTEIKQTVSVDDRIDVLRKTEKMKITAYHPSSFTE